jgi:hypothetical protein
MSLILARPDALRATDGSSRPGRTMGNKKSDLKWERVYGSLRAHVGPSYYEIIVLNNRATCQFSGECHSEFLTNKKGEIFMKDVGQCKRAAEIHLASRQWTAL